MIVPAEAFAECVPQDLAPGSIFKLPDAWALLVINENEDGAAVPSYILLQGERAGTLSEVRKGMSACLTLAEPFAWFPAVPNGTLPSRDVFETASLSVTASGPVVVGGTVDRMGDADMFAFNMAGQLLGEAPRGAVNRYGNWTAELCHPSRPFVSLGQIFEVDRFRV